MAHIHRLAPARLSRPDGVSYLGHNKECASLGPDLYTGKLFLSVCLRVHARVCVRVCVIKIELKSLLGPKTNTVGALLSSHLLKLGDQRSSVETETKKHPGRAPPPRSQDIKSWGTQGARPCHPTRPPAPPPTALSHSRGWHFRRQWGAGAGGV